MVKQMILWCLTAVFTADSVMRLVRSTFNLGTGMMYGITLGLWVYTLFHRPIDAFVSHGVGFWLKIAFFAGCAFMAAMMLFLALAKPVGGEADGSEQAVIVLGAGLRGDVVSGLLARRLDAAYEAYEKNPQTMLVVTGGQGLQETRPEAHAMRDYLLARGVPATHILVEDKSTSTEENFAFAMTLLREAGIDENAPLAFATNRFHCYRAALYARAAGFTQMRALGASIGVSSVLPCYMREVMALLYYWAFKQ